MKKLDSIAVSEHCINEFNKLNFIDLENYAKEKHFLCLPIYGVMRNVQMIKKVLK